MPKNIPLQLPMVSKQENTSYKFRTAYSRAVQGREVSGWPECLGEFWWHPCHLGQDLCCEWELTGTQKLSGHVTCRRKGSARAEDDLEAWIPACIWTPDRVLWVPWIPQKALLFQSPSTPWGWSTIQPLLRQEAPQQSSTLTVFLFYSHSRLCCVAFALRWVCPCLNTLSSWGWDLSLLPLWSEP